MKKNLIDLFKACTNIVFILGLFAACVHSGCVERTGNDGERTRESD